MKMRCNTHTVARFFVYVEAVSYLPLLMNLLLPFPTGDETLVFFETNYRVFYSIACISQ
jgi:hypothetical protein